MVLAHCYRAGSTTFGQYLLSSPVLVGSGQGKSQEYGHTRPLVTLLPAPPHLWSASSAPAQSVEVQRVLGGQRLVERVVERVVAVGDEQWCQATCRGKSWRRAMEGGIQDIFVDLVLTQRQKLWWQNMYQHAVEFCNNCGTNSSVHRTHMGIIANALHNKAPVSHNQNMYILSYTILLS